MATFRQKMNAVAHIEPTGDEVFGAAREAAKAVEPAE
jgi:hypothetical protein